MKKTTAHIILFDTLFVLNHGALTYINSRHEQTQRDMHAHTPPPDPPRTLSSECGKVIFRTQAESLPELDAPAPDQHSTFEPLRPWSCLRSLWQFELSLWTKSSEGTFSPFWLV